MPIYYIVSDVKVRTQGNLAISEQVILVDSVSERFAARSRAKVSFSINDDNDDNNDISANQSS